MKEFFVEQILDGYLITAFPIAVIAGLISFLSPCVLPLGTWLYFLCSRVFKEPWSSASWIISFRCRI